jgi:hypothetical protein
MSSGGKGNSKARTDSTQNTTNTQETTNNVDNRVFNQTENNSFSDSRQFLNVDDRQQNTTTINALDGGAISDAFSFAKSALAGLFNSQSASGSSIIGGAFDLGGNSVSGANKVASDAVKANRDALDSAFGFGSNALAGAFGSNADALTGAFKFGTSAMDNLAEVTKNSYEGALSFGTNALDTVRSLNSSSLDLLGALASGAVDNSRTLARDAIDSNNAATKAAINGFQSLATQNSASSDDRLQKVVQYALVAIAAIMILPRLFSGSSKGAAFA